MAYEDILLNYDDDMGDMNDEELDGNEEGSEEESSEGGDEEE